MSQNNQNSGENQANKRKFIVMDIVFYGSSLNYDQGSGNLQELKKITGWDGKEYTLVSRYALRYSLLKTGEQLGLWKLAPGEILERSGGEGKTVIQPSIKILLSGEILKYPDYDFFGYLITGTTPQNSREAPVKISHAISMTPYNYDSHFAGNLDLARRMVEAGKAEKMDPNLFTIEEHQTYYVYTVVIDIDRIGKNEIYLAKKEGSNWEVDVEWNSNKKINIKKAKNNELKGEYSEFDDEVDVKYNKDLENIHKFIQKVKDIDNVKKEKIKNLIKAILNLNRDIKARKEVLRPKLLILGLYEGSYQTFKDRIRLSNAYEEIYEEERMPDENNKNKIKIIRRVVKLNKPVFEIVGEIGAKNWGDNQPPVINEKEILEGQNNESPIDKFFDSNEIGIWIYKSPETEVKKPQLS